MYKLRLNKFMKFKSIISGLFLILSLTGCSSGGFKVVIENIDKNVTISPGIYILHTREEKLNFENKIASAGLLDFLKTGNKDVFSKELKDKSGTFRVFALDKEIGPGQSTTFYLTAPESDVGVYLSGFSKIKGSDDSYVYLGGLGLYDITDPKFAIESESLFRNFDAGMSETLTQPVVEHPVYTSTILKITIIPQ